MVPVIENSNFLARTINKRISSGTMASMFFFKSKTLRINDTNISKNNGKKARRDAERLGVP